MSAPFVGETFTFTDAAGREITLRGWGNQHHAVFEDLNGYTVVLDPDTGNYHYATLNEDKSRLKPTENVVGQSDPAELAMSPGLRAKRPPLGLARSEAAFAEARDPRRWVERRHARAAEASRASSSSSLELDAGPPSRTTVGNYVGLCILVQFPDVPGTISKAEVENFCNQVGYNANGNNGSVHDYFHDVSDGQLTYTNIVTEYYTAANNRSYYTDESISQGVRARELINEALDHLSANGFDFSGLTADGSGYIYALNVFYAGPVVNNWAQGLWPHQWALSPSYDIGGGRRFRDYQITNMGSQLKLRTFCHENGHMICDFPDLYDYGGESVGPGHFCLMGYGGSNVNPTQVGAYLKNAAGWADSLTTITPGMNATVQSGVNEFYVHRKNSSEYFIIENRQRSGRDASLPDDGLAIWHVDHNGSNNNEQMTPAQHYECSLIQADNRFDLEGKANYGDADDLYSGPTTAVFSDTTAPDAKWWDGSNSGLHIHSISNSGSSMSFATLGTDDGGSDGPVCMAGVYELLL